MKFVLSITILILSPWMAQALGFKCTSSESTNTFFLNETEQKTTGREFITVMSAQGGKSATLLKEMESSSNTGIGSPAKMISKTYHQTLDNQEVSFLRKSGFSVQKITTQQLAHNAAGTMSLHVDYTSPNDGNESRDFDCRMTAQ